MPAGARGRFEPLTAELALRFYGKTPARSMRGFAYVAGGEPLLLMGVMREAYRWVLFSDTAPGARGAGNFAARRAALAGAKLLLGIIASLQAPVHAVPEGDGSCEMLERLGFQPIGQGVYAWAAP